MVSGTSSPLHGYKEKRLFPFLSLSSLSPSLSLSVTMATSLLFGFVFWWREQLMLEQTGHSKPLPLSLSSSSSSCTWDKGRRKEEGESKFTSHSKLTLTTGLRCNRRLGTSFLFLRMKIWKLSYSAKPHPPPPPIVPIAKGEESTIIIT